MTPEAFEAAVSQLLDNDLSAEGFAELEHYLQHSPEARQKYLEFVDMHNVLDLEHQPKAVTQLGTSKVIPIDRIIRRQKRRTVRIALTAAAACILLSLVALRLFFATPPHTPSLAFKTSPGTQFTISHEQSANTPTGQIMAPGSRLQLSQGSVELNFSSGTKAVVMAPADMTLHDGDQLYLRQGTAWFHVPKGAEGFRVETGDLQMVDLGTEFGVISHPAQHDEVHILKGKVEVSAKRIRKQTTILTAGQARRIDPIGRLTKIPSNPEAFLNTLPTSLPYLHWSFDQNKPYSVQGSHPLVHTLETQPFTPAKSSLSDPSIVPGVHGKALDLNGAGQHLVTNWPGFSDGRPVTASFWIRLPDSSYNDNESGILGWGDRSLSTGKWKITLKQHPDHDRPNLRISWGNLWADSSTTLSRGTWHHIIITHGQQTNENPQAQVYINGIPETITTQRKSKESPKASTRTRKAVPLLIGSSLHYATGRRKTLHASLDELYLFDGHMSPAQAQQLFQEQSPRR
ncbi:FecR domain-containing protein [Verrucomicrobiaceae bacterium N1E253]|uniref:FecR domain-containing protein n=1 Tax=Oceaniferula marina TaxID=2748318 RepID=A0A851GKV2_9BACT|nr:LamG-like jellyroll fold domain-containing protein [Oceaniferula marina]NWK55805.1 FecR domain-containing protein [Oceaniferula marina]